MLCRPVIRSERRFQAVPGGRADRAGIFAFLLVNFSGFQRMEAGFFRTRDSKIPYQLGVWTGTGGVVEQKEKSCKPLLLPG